eukprot:6793588-Pyramimonas_sp.AAC.1
MVPRVSLGIRRCSNGFDNSKEGCFANLPEFVKSTPSVANGISRERLDRPARCTGTLATSRSRPDC